MPIRPPALDDRTFEDLVDELLTRIPAHTPEWTNPQLGDPGRTLIELFAWLTSTLLYRVNLVPERQRLVFLRLLGQPLRPATPASGVISIAIDDENVATAVTLQPLATLSGPATFETTAEVTVLPVSVAAYVKRPLTDREQSSDLADVVDGLQQVYGLAGSATPYVTTAVFAQGAADPSGVDLPTAAVDSTLWLALLAAKPELVDAARRALGADANGAAQVISIGVSPTLTPPGLLENVGPRGRLPVVWEMTTGRDIGGEPEYRALDVLDSIDTSAGLTRQGVVRLVLPGTDSIGAPSNDVGQLLLAGVGDRPPRIDDPTVAGRLVTWLRLRPRQQVSRLGLSWVGINAVELDQRQTTVGRVIGMSDGSADQQMDLAGQSVDPDSLQVEVEEPAQGYRPWMRIDDLALAGRDDAVYSLDAEAGTIRFGDRIHGRVPDPGLRVRVARMRCGGGPSGNLPPNQLKTIQALDVQNQPAAVKLKVQQSLTLSGGQAAESLMEAEQRIPSLFRTRDRAVTRDDYVFLAATTPGTQIGRVEVMPRFKPQQRRSDVPGVVSVMVIPAAGAPAPPNPRADRAMLERVFAQLDARRPIATELYVIGCEYVPIGASVGITIADGFGREAVLTGARDSLRAFLWPLPPGGMNGGGWPLARTVRAAELEVAVARVPGVASVLGLNLFESAGSEWQAAGSEISLEAWQLPELLSVVVVDDAPPPTDLRAVPNPFANQGGVPVPVVPRLC
jgi:Baseplate J-like protein